MQFTYLRGTTAQQVLLPAMINIPFITGTLHLRVPISDSTSSEGIVDKTMPRLDISIMNCLMGRYFAKGLAESGNK